MLQALSTFGFKLKFAFLYYTKQYKTIFGLLIYALAIQSASSSETYNNGLLTRRRRSIGKHLATYCTARSRPRQTHKWQNNNDEHTTNNISSNWFSQIAHLVRFFPTPLILFSTFDFIVVCEMRVLLGRQFFLLVDHAIFDHLNPNESFTILFLLLKKKKKNCLMWKEIETETLSLS